MYLLTPDSGLIFNDALEIHLREDQATQCAFPQSRLVWFSMANPDLAFLQPNVHFTRKTSVCLVPLLWIRWMPAVTQLVRA